MSDLAYYRLRASEEWAAVGIARSDETRIIHAELAKRYVALANQADNVVAIKPRGVAWTHKRSAESLSA